MSQRRVRGIPAMVGGLAPRLFSQRMKSTVPGYGLSIINCAKVKSALIAAAEVAKRFEVAPRVAMISFSNFGSTRHPLADKVRRAVAIARERAPQLAIDGEMQADTAVTPEILQETYPFSRIKEGANVLVFPNLEAGNAAYKLLARLGEATVIGPILMGLAKPVHVLQRGASVEDIVNMAAISVVDAQSTQSRVDHD